LSRRRILAGAGGAALAALLPGWLLGKDANASKYEKDVEFLLAELPKKAGRFFELKGVDWAAVSRQFRDEGKKVKTDQEHLKLCTRLVARLRDGHAALVDLKVKPADESRGRRYTGPRVHLLVAGEKAYVRAAFGTAAQRGVEPGMEVLKIDGVPAHAWLGKRVDTLRDDHGYSTDHEALYAACHWGLADWEGTRIQFELSKEQRKKTIAIVRQGGPNFAPFGPVFPPRDLKQLERQSYGKTARGTGYIHLRDVPGSLPDQLDTMLEALGDIRSLILDCRANGGGGCDHEAVFARFLAPGKRWRQYSGAGKRPFTGPMVVVVDAGVRSAGETISGMFKEDGRAYMIGDTPTAGTSSQKEKLAVPSGLFAAYYSVASNKQRFNGGKGIEGIGVPPHEVVPYDPKELLAAVDTQIRRADELLTAGLPEDKVPYR
jgi:C-terminal processing protease CtpA/Prc